MKRFHLFLSAFVAVAVAGGVAVGVVRPAWGTELSLEKRVVEHTCANGIKLLILERHFSPTVAIRMIFRTGSVDEIEGKTGLAHMFEHMMFKGTRTMGTKNYAKEAPLLDAVDQAHQALNRERAKGAKADQAQVGRLIEKIREAEEKAGEFVVANEMWNLYEREGASGINAGTGADLTQYQVDLPSNKLKLWAIVDSDRLKNPVFRQFYQEREVVKEERRMRVDTNPDGQLYEKFIAVAFSSHPYHHPTIGWEKDLDSLTVEDQKAFYRQHYTPERLTIVIVGDVKAKDVIAMVDQYFGTWKAAPRCAAPAIVPEPAQTAQRRVDIESEAEPRLFMGFKLPRYPDPDYFLFSAIARLLAHGDSSRLYKAIVEKRHLAASVDADPAAPGERENPVFMIAATPRWPNTPALVEKAIWAELEALKNTPIEPWELEKVRASVDMDLLNTLQTNSGMASTLAYNQCIFGDWRILLKYQKFIEGFTAADIQRAANRIFKTETSTVATRIKKVEKREKKKK